MSENRRSFLKASLAGAAAAALDPSSAAAQGTQQIRADWLDRLAAAPHKTFLDVPHFHADELPFRRVNNLMDALQTGYGVPAAEIAIAVGFHGTGLAFVLSPDCWEQARLVDWLVQDGLKPADAAKGAAVLATRAQQLVREAQARGAQPLACGQTISRLAVRLAPGSARTTSEWDAFLRASLPAGVPVVPAMVAAAVLAQERRAAYIIVT